MQLFSRGLFTIYILNQKYYLLLFQVINLKKNIEIFFSVFMMKKSQMIKVPTSQMRSG